MEKKVAIVTGVSSGIGRVTAAELVGAGFQVFGSVRSKNSEVPPGVERVSLDVRDDTSVETAVKEILSRTGRIDALVNNAGTSIIGAIEETEMQQAQELFDLNFFGSVRMTRAVLPLMRAQHTGRIVFISSVVGFLPAPFMGFYSASKHALEGYAESLDHEVRKMGLQTSLIQPGFMKTRLGHNSGQATRTLPDYAIDRRRAEASINASVEHGDDPMLVARAVLKALTAARPRLRYQVGRSAGMLAVLRSFAPASLFGRALRKSFGLD